MKKSTAFLLLAASVLPGERGAAYEIVPIERMNGDSVVDLSADGSTVVGTGFGETASGTTAAVPIRWTRQEGAVEVGRVNVDQSTGGGSVSDDGMVVAGYGGPGAPYTGYHWSAASGLTQLGSLPGEFALGSLVRAVSGDGRTVVGYDFADRPFRWTAEEGMVALDRPSGAQGAQAMDVSADGSVIAVRGGLYQNNVLNAEFPAIWKRTSGYQSLGPLPVGWDVASPVALSADGSTVIGLGGTGTEGSPSGRPFRWTESEGLHALPTLHGGLHFRVSMTADGSVILGNEQNEADWTPVVWTDAHTVQRLHDILLEDHAFDPEDLYFNFTRAISADQRTLVVRSGTERGNYKLWALYLDKPLIGQTSPGDFNHDGAVDGADFLAWQQGRSPAPLSAEDLVAWKQNFGHPGTVGGAATVPEPSAAALVAGLAVFCGRLGRWRAPLGGGTCGKASHRADRSSPGFLICIFEVTSARCL